MNAGQIGGLIGCILGTIGGIFGTYCGIRRARSPRERNIVIKFSLFIWILVIVTLIGEQCLSSVSIWFELCIWIPFIVIVLFSSLKMNNILIRTRKEEEEKK